MKTLKLSILMLLVGAFCAQAEPLLWVEAVISEHHSDGVTDVIKPRGVTVPNGRETYIKAGILEYAVTPYLHDDGRVSIHAVLIRHGEEKIDKYFAPVVKVDLDERAHVHMGRFDISTIVNVAR